MLVEGEAVAKFLKKLSNKEYYTLALEGSCFLGDLVQGDAKSYSFDWEMLFMKRLSFMRNCMWK